jgi:23S rRNA-intervening sequence protein
MANIAEGFGRRSDKEFANFLNMARCLSLTGAQPSRLPSGSRMQARTLALQFKPNRDDFKLGQPYSWLSNGERVR